MLDTELSDLTVVKRSGQRVLFNQLKIAVAIKAAFDNTENTYEEKDINKVFEDTLKYITNNYHDRKTINVEDIQDIIENVLKSDHYPDIFQSFSDYRIRRAESRKAFSEKQQHKFVKAIEKIGNIKTNNEKAISSFYKFGETIASEYNKSYILDNKFIRAHEEGKIYLHNLPYFNLGFLYDTKVDVTNYLNDEEDFLNLLDFLSNVKEEIMGTIYIENFDKILSQYTMNKYKKVYLKYLTNYLKIFGYNNLLNFKKISEIINKSLNFDISLNEILDNSNPIIANILTETKKDSLSYINDFLHQNLNRLFISLENNGRQAKYTFTFGANLQTKYLEDIILTEINKLPVLKNISFVYELSDELNNSTLENVALIILNGKNIYLKGNHEKFNTNITEVSINLARLGLKYQTLSELFYQELDENLELARNALIFIFETIGDKYKENYQYLFNGNIIDDEKLEDGQKIRKVIKSNTLTLNIIGLKECALSIDENNYQNIVFNILNHLNIKLTEFMQDSKYNFILTAKNELNASNFMIELDKTIFGIIPKLTKKDAYENLGNLNSKQDYTYFKKLDTYFKNGILFNIDINKSVTLKHVCEYLNAIKTNNLSLCKINIKGDNYDN